MLKLYLKLIASLVAITNAVQIQPRIINGVSSESGQFPYYVFLFHSRTTENASLCGGSLISDKYTQNPSTNLNYFFLNITFHFIRFSLTQVDHYSRTLPSRIGDWKHDHIFRKYKW